MRSLEYTNRLIFRLGNDVLAMPMFLRGYSREHARSRVIRRPAPPEIQEPTLVPFLVESIPPTQSAISAELCLDEA